MFILIGVKTITKRLWVAIITCTYCLQRRPHQLIERTEWGTLFFIPIVPLKRQRILTCNICGRPTMLSKDQATDLMATVPSEVPPGTWDR